MASKFVEANIHAREWIAVGTATWLINQFLTSSDPSVRDMAENIDWYFIPVANPDGYSYSHPQTISGVKQSKLGLLFWWSRNVK